MRYCCAVSTSAEVLYERLEEFLQRLYSLAETDAMAALLDLDLSFSQVRGVLALMQAAEPVPVSELAKRLQLSVAAAGRTVDQLVRLGVVERQESADDRRVKLVSLSPQGLDLAVQHLDTKRQAVRSFVDRLADADCQRLAEALGPILAGDCLRSDPKEAPCQQ